MGGNSNLPFPPIIIDYHSQKIPRAVEERRHSKMFSLWPPISVLDVSPLIFRFRFILATFFYTVHRGNNRALLLNEKRRRRRESHNAGKSKEMKVQSTDRAGPSQSVILGHCGSTFVVDISALRTIERERNNAGGSSLSFSFLVYNAKKLIFCFCFFWLSSYYMANRVIIFLIFVAFRLSPLCHCPFSLFFQ